VYGIFFSVESFYNFEGHSDAKNIIAWSSHAHQEAGRHTTAVRNSPLPHPSAHHLRLNKRFHQENFSPCPVYQVDSPEYTIVPRALGNQVAAPLPFITRFHFQHRGPPSVV
jgi:hypothetical protein